MFKIVHDRRKLLSCTAFILVGVQSLNELKDYGEKGRNAEVFSNKWR